MRVPWAVSARHPGSGPSPDEPTGAPLAPHAWVARAWPRPGGATPPGPPAPDHRRDTATKSRKLAHGLCNVTLCDYVDAGRQTALDRAAGSRPRASRLGPRASRSRPRASRRGTGTLPPGARGPPHRRPADRPPARRTRHTPAHHALAHHRSRAPHPSPGRGPPPGGPRSRPRRGVPLTRRPHTVSSRGAAPHAPPPRDRPAALTRTPARSRPDPPLTHGSAPAPAPRPRPVPAPRPGPRPSSPHATGAAEAPRAAAPRPGPAHRSPPAHTPVRADPRRAGPPPPHGAARPRAPRAGAWSGPPPAPWWDECDLHSDGTRPIRPPS